MKKVLLIDDDRIFITQITSILAKKNYEISIAGNAAQAFENLNAQIPDLIVMDVLMPEMTGYHLVKELQKDDKFKKIPVLVISSRESLKDVFDSWTIVGFVKKPFLPENLIKEVERVIGQSFEDKPAAAPAPAPVPVAAAPEVSGGGKKVLVAAYEEYVLGKLKAHFESLGFAVVTAVSDKDAIEEAAKLKPDFVFAQYLEDPSKMDSQSIAMKLQENPETKSAAFFTFCIKDNSSEALKKFKVHQVLTYKKIDELLQKIPAALESGMAKAA